MFMHIKTELNKKLFKRLCSSIYEKLEILSFKHEVNQRLYFYLHTLC
jgi:hypothetical protein